MNTTIARLAAALSAAAVSLSAAPSLASLEGERLFEVDYGSLHHAATADAQFAKGSPRATVLHAPRPSFEVEPTESVCHGLLVGEGYASLRYETAGNLAAESGSIELVFENRGWLGSEPGTCIFAQCNGKDSTLYIYKHGNDGVGVYLGNANPKWSCFPRVMQKDFPKGKGRHHLLFTYAPAAVRLYFDGRFVREIKPGGAFSGWARTFSVGPGGRFGRTSQSTVICRMATYCRPLTGEEARLLAAARLPHIKLSEIPKTELETIPASRLLREAERLGLEALEADWVPSPFLPVVRDGACFRVWNRVYDFGGGALLQGIRSGGDELLSAPVSLEGTHGGTPFALQVAPIAGLLVDGKGRKVFSRAVTAPAWVQGEVITTIEYDGAVRFDFKLKGLEAAEALQLRVPMAQGFEEAFHYTGTTGYRMRSIVAPDTSYTHLLPKERTGELMARPFCTHVWLGGTRGGVQLIHDSDRAFWPKDPASPFAVERQPGQPAALVARYVLPGAKIPAGGLAEFRFGLLATPVRPMPKGWRAWMLSAQYDTLQGEARGSHLVYWPDGWKSRISLDPDPERARDKTHTPQVVATDRAAGRKILPYWNHRQVGIRSNNCVSPDDGFLRAHFEPHPSRPDSGGAREAVRVFSGTGYTDYLMRCVAAWGRIFGPLDGVYIDEMENLPNDDARTGGGYTTPDGKRHLTYSTCYDRDMYKRLDAVVRRQTGGAAPSSISHCSGMLMMDQLSHFTIMLTGEHLYSGYFPHRKDLLPPEHDRLYYYSYSLPMERVRTEFYHRPWGIVMAFLPCLKNQRDIMTRPEPTRDLLSRLMHADILYWPLWGNAQEIYKMYRWRRDFDIGSDAVEFIPSWENRTITSTSPDVCISFYRKHQDYLVIVSNLGRAPATIEVSLPPGIAAVRDAETRRVLPMADGKVSLAIPRNDFRALRLF